MQRIRGRAFHKVFWVEFQHARIYLQVIHACERRGLSLLSLFWMMTRSISSQPLPGTLVGCAHTKVAQGLSFVEDACKWCSEAWCRAHVSVSGWTNVNQRLQWPKFMAVYAGFWAFQNLIRPARFAASVAITPAFDKLVDMVQDKVPASSMPMCPNTHCLSLEWITCAYWNACRNWDTCVVLESCTLGSEWCGAEAILPGKVEAISPWFYHSRRTRRPFLCLRLCVCMRVFVCVHLEMIEYFWSAIISRSSPGSLSSSWVTCFTKSTWRAFPAGVIDYEKESHQGCSIWAGSVPSECFRHHLLHGIWAHGSNNMCTWVLHACNHFPSISFGRLRSHSMDRVMHALCLYLHPKSDHNVLCWVCVW